MLLFRKKITGWDTFVDEATSGVFPYLADTTNPDAGQWDDITSVENWDLYGHRTQLTTKEVRDEIKALYTTWAAASAAEKDVFSRWFVADKSDRDTIHSAAEQTEYANLMCERMVADSDAQNIEDSAADIAANDASTADSIAQDSVPGKEINLDFGFSGIYATTSTTFAYVAIQVIIPEIADIYPQGTKIEGKFCLSYRTDGSATAEAELYSYTGSASVTGSQISLPNGTWVYGSSGTIDLTAYAGKAIRIGWRRVGGTGSDSIDGEAAQLILKYS